MPDGRYSSLGSAVTSARAVVPRHKTPFPRQSHPAAHEAVRWWSAAHGQEERAAAEGDAAAPQQLDVFGVARAPLDLQRALVWHGLRPGDDTRVARAAGVGAVVCSGHGPNDVTVRPMFCWRESRVCSVPGSSCIVGKSICRPNSCNNKRS